MRSLGLAAIMMLSACTSENQSAENLSSESAEPTGALNASTDSDDAERDYQVIGRWCDKMVPSMPSTWMIMTFRRMQDGEVELHIEAGDGSEAVFAIEEEGAGNFRRADNQDRYRIIQSSGELEASDADGFIGAAQRLENSPKAGECLK